LGYKAPLAAGDGVGVGVSTGISDVEDGALLVDGIPVEDIMFVPFTRLDG
jgi:hypothetical protein